MKILEIITSKQIMKIIITFRKTLMPSPQASIFFLRFLLLTLRSSPQASMFSLLYLLQTLLPSPQASMFSLLVILLTLRNNHNLCCHHFFHHHIFQHHILHRQDNRDQHLQHIHLVFEQLIHLIFEQICSLRSLRIVWISCNHLQVVVVFL